MGGRARSIAFAHDGIDEAVEPRPERPTRTKVISPVEPAGARSDASASPGDTYKGHVVIVGADPLFVETVTPQLEALGMMVVHPGTTSMEARRRSIPESAVVVLDADGKRDDDVMSLSRDMPDTKHVLMSGSLDQAGVRAALREGFRGAISKDIPLDRFGSAILSVAQGDLVVEVESFRRPTGVDADITSAVAASLTRREREVLALLVEGATGAEMATRLSLSPHTVRTHVQNVMSKLQVHSRVEAVAYAVRHRFVHPKEGTRPDEVA
jgi:two-component system nitrate/nitrite response regulator NarL